MAYVSVTIRKQNGPTVSLQVKPESTTVGRLKSMVAQNFGIEARRQRLTFNGREMDSDYETLSNYGVAAHSTIDVSLMAVSVTVRQQNRGFTILVEVTPETVTVRQFKVMLAQDVGIRARRQSLTINGREMEDNQTLSYYGVAANSTIIVDEERDYGEVRFKGGGAIIGDFLHELETESSTSSGSD